MAEYNPPVEEPTPEPEPEPEPQPDLDSLLAEERAKQAEREKDLEMQAARYEERLKSLEGILQQGFSQKTPPPTTNQPPVTDEDFLTPAEAKAASERIAREEALKVGRAIDNNYRQVMQDTQEALFEQRYAKHEGSKYFKYIKSDLDTAIRENPNLKMAPKALDVLVKSLVGDKMDVILAAEKESQDPPLSDPPPTARPSIASPRRRVAPPAGPENNPSEGGEVVLDADAEAVRAKFAPYISRLSNGKRELSPDRFAQSLAERGRTKRPIPNLEDKNAS